MGPYKQYIPDLKIYGITLFILAGFAFWIKIIPIGTDWQQAGLTTFSLGFILLAAYITAQILRIAGLPLISGYIFAGILAGPYTIGFLSHDMVARFRLADDLALSFIALTAGGTLHLEFLRKCGRAISINILLQTLVVFAAVFFSFSLIACRLNLMPDLTDVQITILACLLGLIAVAQSPLSAIAIINECRAAGMFTTTVLGVTVALDVLIIILFILAVTVSETVMGTRTAIDFRMITGLTLAVAGSLGLGALLGKGISLYISKAGHDLSLFLLFFAFSVFKACLWFNHFMESHFAVSLHLEPLLICISAGFTVQNFSRYGHIFMEAMERFELPIFVLFFSIAGASLNLDALLITWPLAVFLVIIRTMGLFGSTWAAGLLNRDPSQHRRIAWMAYITQSAIAVGLAQLAQRQFPEFGGHLTTLVLAVITINQVVGPILFKIALKKAGEVKEG
jgi:Kef-type K+ transport system membrane component KefB